QAVVARARPNPSGDVWITERGLNGFALRIYRSGRKAYVLKYQQGTRRPKVTIGEPGAPWRPDPVTGAARVLTPELARDEAIRLLGGLIEGREPAAQRGQRGGMPTLAEFVGAPKFDGRYFRDHADKHKSARTAAGDRSNLRVHLLPALGSRPLDRITVSDVVRLHASMSSTPVTANRCVALLSGILGKARTWEVLPQSHVNPCRGDSVERFEEGRHERFLQPDELARVGLAMRGQLPIIGSKPESDFACAALVLIMLTGARPGEIAGFRREWLNRLAGIGVMPRSKTSKRTGKPRVIVFNAPALAVYDDIPEVPGNPYLIPSPKMRAKPMSIYTLEAAWERVRAAAGVEDVRLVDLRHTFASVAIGEVGETLVMIQTLLSHTNPATTLRYAHLARGPQHAASERVATAIAGALKPKG
ncbi:MAG TPA: site-specific integrase, partial [Conexibacter sp.]|nr:site-specific integrase [Conexibacter sp.]